MNIQKNKLLSIAQKVKNSKKITVDEMSTLSTFTKLEEDSFAVTILKQATLPLSLLLGFLIAVFPEYFEGFTTRLPAWTNLSPHLLAGVNYLWNILSEPVDQANIFYHIPNVVLYAFGILGIKKLFDAIDKHTWLDKVFAAQTTLKEQIAQGTLSLSLRDGHSILFVGKGDFIGMQFTVDHKPDQTITVAESKPRYSDLWNYYDACTAYDDLKTVLSRVSDDSTGEYVFFPVKDDQIFFAFSYGL